LGLTRRVSWTLSYIPFACLSRAERSGRRSASIPGWSWSGRASWQPSIRTARSVRRRASAMARHDPLRAPVQQARCDEPHQLCKRARVALPLAGTTATQDDDTCEAGPMQDGANALQRHYTGALFAYCWAVAGRCGLAERTNTRSVTGKSSTTGSTTRAWPFPEIRGLGLFARHISKDGSV
jgi:hypothetical protein